MFLQSSLPSTSDSVTKAASVLNISQGASNIDNKTCQNAPIVDDNKPTPSTPRRDKSIKARSVQQQLLSPSNATSPRKRKLLNIINTKEHIIKKQRLQIKRIQAQNRRLKRKLNKIEDILNNIQEKFCLKDEDTNILKNINLQAYYKVNDYIEDKNAWRQAGPAPQGNEKCSNITILELSCSLKSVIGGGTQFARFPAIGELDGAGVRAMLVNGRCQLGLVSFRLY
ncbi:hypothetical protein SFRURICE_017520 [Spodoptera frugiperda]|nr:hypothetical protein SFRURICE_017520 [Spodoptera frugiperda]